MCRTQYFLIGIFVVGLHLPPDLLADQYADIEQLRQQYQQQTTRAESLAGKYRELSPDSPKRREIKKSLEQLIHQTFHLRQQLQRKEIDLAQQELEHLEKRLEERTELKDAIVRRRVEDLLFSRAISWTGEDDFEPKPIRRIRPGDVLAIYIEGVLPANPPNQPPQPPPVTKLESGGIVSGFPFAVAHDGTIQLPLIERIKVAGLTIPEAEGVIRDAYIDEGILRPEKARPILMLVRKEDQVKSIIKPN